MTTRYIMIGGFLGAGKTTTVGRLARHYQRQGRRVAIVTNDQTTDLVDTHNLRSQGFDVGEVAGSCFCCNFNELTATVERLGNEAAPDVILAEPVGSCTDLVATVIRPLTQIYQRPLEVAPYGVILKPSHGERILSRAPQGGFSPQAEYIFRKQLEEADFLLVNRIDELPPAKVERLVDLLQAEYPGRPVLRVSAKTGAGFEALREFLEQRGDFGQRIMDVDYDIYAEGEAELGWLNSQVVVEAETPFAVDHLLLDLITRLHQRLVADATEAAHLKVIALGEGTYGVANLVSNEQGPELSLPSQAHERRIDLVVNARVAADPQVLEQFVRDELAQAARSANGTIRVQTMQSFRPGRPVPTHRINVATT